MYKEFIKHHWLTLISIILSIIVSAYYYGLSVRTRDLIFVVDPNKTTILSSESISKAPIKVLKTNNGEEIKSDLMAVKFYVWNQGKESIRAENVLERIVIQLDDPAGEIIDAKILRISRDITKMSIRPDLENPKQKIILDLYILEHNDGLTGQIIYVGNPRTNFNIKGIIEGQDQIRTNDLIAKSKMFYDLCKYVGVIVFSILAAILFAVIGSYLEKRGQLLADSKKFKLSEKAEKKIGIAILIFFALFFMFIVAFPARYELQEDAKKKIVEIVPSSIIPSNN